MRLPIQTFLLNPKCRNQSNHAGSNCAIRPTNLPTTSEFKPFHVRTLLACRVIPRLCLSRKLELLNRCRPDSSFESGMRSPIRIFLLNPNCRAPSNFVRFQRQNTQRVRCPAYTELIPRMNIHPFGFFLCVSECFGLVQENHPDKSLTISNLQHHRQSHV